MLINRFENPMLIGLERQNRINYLTGNISKEDDNRKNNT
jgi:hypothetical protein